MAAGFIALPRWMKDSPVWVNANPTARDLIITLMLNVTWKPVEWNEYGTSIFLRPGQLITTKETLRKMLAKRTTYAQVRNALRYLERTGLITTEGATDAANSRTLITLTGWEEMQGAYGSASSEEAEEVTAESATERQQSDSRATAEQQASDSTIKRTINHKQGNKVTSIPPISPTGGQGDGDEPKPRRKREPFVKPTLEEVAAFMEGYAREKGACIDVGEESEDFFDFYEANGWVQGQTAKKLSDWKAAARGWIRRRKNFEPPRRRGPERVADYVEAFEEVNRREGHDGKSEGDSSNVFGVSGFYNRKSGFL